MIYIISVFIFMFVLVIGFLYPKTKKIFELFLVIYFIIISGFRYYVGTDYKTYVVLAEAIISGAKTYMEPGFEGMISLTHYLGFITQTIFLISSIITIICFWKFIKRNSSNTEFSLILFFLMPVFLFASFNGVRQFIAIGIFLYSTKFIESRRFYAYILCIAVGSLFHKTILLMIPCYFVFNKIHSFKTYLLIACGYFFVAFLVGKFGMLIGGPEKYFNEIFDFEFNYKSLVPVILLIFLFIRRNIYFEYSTDSNLTFNLLFFSSLIVLTPLLSDIPSGLVLRISSYFTPVIVVVLVNLSSTFYKPMNKLVYNVMIFFGGLSYFVSTLVVNGEKYSLLPYQFNFVLF